MTEPPVLSIVIPVYCESQILVQVIHTVQESVEGLQMPYEIIIVDDGSIDDTWRVLSQEAATNCRLRGVRFSRNFGKESALCAGIDLARGRAVITMDGDLQHPPQLIPEMVRLWKEEGAEIVEGIKASRGREPWWNRVGAAAFYFLLARLSGYNLKGLSDYKLMDRKAVDAWLRVQERNLFFRGMVAWIGFKHARVTFTLPERLGGRSKWSLYHLMGLSLDAIIKFSSKPLQIISLIGLVFLLGAVKVLFDVITQVLNHTAVSGFATVILLLLIIGSMLMFSLSLIGMYISKIYDEVKQRPRYIVSDQIDNG